MMAVQMPARAERHPHLLTSKPLPSCMLHPPAEVLAWPYEAGRVTPGHPPLLTPGHRICVRVAEVAGTGAANGGAATGVSPSKVICVYLQVC